MSEQANPREGEYEAAAYIYYDDKLNEVFRSSQPKSDAEAKDHYYDLFEREPAFIHARRFDGKHEALEFNPDEYYEEPTPEEREELDGLGSSNA
jgi:hypothetical protein